MLNYLYIFIATIIILVIAYVNYRKLVENARDNVEYSYEDKCRYASEQTKEILGYIYFKNKDNEKGFVRDKLFINEYNRLDFENNFNKNK
jgi:hypothetical protein